MPANARILFAALVLSFFAMGCSNSDSKSQNQTAGGASEQSPLSPPQVMHRLNVYCGTICTVGPSFIELAAGWEWSNSENWHENSNSTRTLVSREAYDNSRPKRVITANTRPGGKFDGEPCIYPVVPEETHLVIDVRIGDRIAMWAGVSREGDEWAMQLAIWRRPNGTIPPMCGESPLKGEHAHHLQAQAEQAWEEKGIPIPKQHLSSDGRAPWTNPPYPPAAPMPRPAKS